MSELVDVPKNESTLEATPISESTKIEIFLISIYFIILVLLFFGILKRVKNINSRHANETGINALKYGCLLVRRRVFVLLILLFIVSSIIIINLI